MSFKACWARPLLHRRYLSFKYLVVGLLTLNLLFIYLSWKDKPVHKKVPRLLESANKIKNFDRANQDKVVERFISKYDLKSEDRTSSWTDKPWVYPGDTFHKTICSYRTATYLGSKRIRLNQDPFSEYLNKMVCLDDADVAVFGNKFAKFKNFIIDMANLTDTVRGGEKLEEVINQREDEEFIKLIPGAFKAACIKKPNLTFDESLPHVEWSRILECYQPNQINMSQFRIVEGTTLAIQRVEYVNLYHTMADFYNAFVLMLIFGITPSKLSILFVDAHPEGSLDEVWSVLFGQFTRAGRLTHPTLFQNLVWGMTGYSSPLSDYSSDNQQVPYLEEFRQFFLSQHNTSTEHTLNCSSLNVVIIWRRDYVAHPRNPRGIVVRKFDNEDIIVEEVKKTVGESASVRGMQLDALPMKNQLEAIASCDILMGMHGAGLSHILFLPATSGVVEFKPNYSDPNLQHFKAMARWRHLPYTQWHNFDKMNERNYYKTYIPRHVIRKVVTDTYEQICRKTTQ